MPLLDEFKSTCVTSVRKSTWHITRTCNGVSSVRYLRKLCAPFLGLRYIYVNNKTITNHKEQQMYLTVSLLNLSSCTYPTFSVSTTCIYYEQNRIYEASVRAYAIRCARVYNVIYRKERSISCKLGISTFPSHVYVIYGVTTKNKKQYT
jgi:hypothetical protein